MDKPLTYIDQVSHNQNFDDEVLKRAILKGSDLTGCSFRGADLSEAILFECVLTNCDFTGANLDGTNLVGAKVDGAIFEDCSLNQALLFDLEKLTNVGSFNPKDSVLGGIVFDGTREATSIDVLKDFTNLDNLTQYAELMLTMTGADISVSPFTYAVPQPMDRTYAISEDLDYKSAWAFSTMNSRSIDSLIDFSKRHLTYSCFMDAEITNHRYYAKNRIDFEGINFEGSNFSKARCKRIEFNNSSFAHADFRGATFKSCNFENCNLENADLRGASFFDCDLEGAKLLNIKVDQNTRLFTVFHKTYVNEHTEIYIEDGTRLVNRIETYDGIAFSESSVRKLLSSVYSFTDEDIVDWEDFDTEDKDKALYLWLKSNTKGLELIIENDDGDGW